MANGYDPNVERIADAVVSIQTVLAAQYADQTAERAIKARGASPRPTSDPNTALQGYLAARWKRRDGDVYG